MRISSFLNRVNKSGTTAHSEALKYTGQSVMLEKRGK